MSAPPRVPVDAGFSLLELLLALLLGMLLSAGVIGVFLSISSEDHLQAVLATLQEDGRIALSRLSDDLRMGNAQYCASVGGGAIAAGSGGQIDAYLRTPLIHVADMSSIWQDLTTPLGGSSGGNTYPARPATAYAWPSFLYMRGYDCGASGCSPVDPAIATAIPALGTTVGRRVIGSDVLTLRYLNSRRGWAIDGQHSWLSSTAGQVSSITIRPQRTETDAMLGGQVMMLADCNAGQVFRGDLDGNTFAVQIDLRGAGIRTPSGLRPRLFDLKQDMLTVSYYLQVVSAGHGHTTGALMRRVNGDSSAAEVIRGIERLDFAYGVMTDQGQLQYMTAGQVDSVSHCPAAERYPLATTPGCLWRFVQSIRVDILLDGESPLDSLPDNLQNYAYLPDGDSAPLAPSAHTISPASQGFPVPMMRRAFSTTVALRNVNP